MLPEVISFSWTRHGIIMTLCVKNPKFQFLLASVLPSRMNFLNDVFEKIQKAGKGNMYWWCQGQFIIFH
jgi:hypothetical protein